MKKLINIVVALTLLLSLVAPFRVQTASAASVTKLPDYLPYGWVVFTDNGRTGAGTNPVIHGQKEAKFIYYTMGDIITGTGGTPGGQVALVGYGLDGAFGTGDDVIVSVAPVASDSAGTFAIATSSVPQDGEYAIRDYTGGTLGNVLVSGIYIRYRFAIDQKSLTYNCSAQTISGWVFRGDGTGAAYNSSITPAGEVGAYTTYVHVIYPSGLDVYTSVLANGQFALSVNVNEKGVYRVYVEDNYGDHTDSATGTTEFGFIYAELPTGKLSITLSTYVEPTYLYNDTTHQQEVVLKAVDQDGDPVTGATFSILDGFSSYTVFEIAPGFYKVVGKKSASKSLASFQVTSTVGGSTLFSNVVSIPFKPLTNFNPVVSVDVYNGDVGVNDSHYYTVSEFAYDKLPCTVGYSIVVKPGVFDVTSGYEIEDVSATVDGPVYMIEDTNPVSLATFENSKTPSSASENVITTVGDPYFLDFNAPGSYPNQVGGNGGLVHDGLYGGKDWYYKDWYYKDWYYDAPRYLITGPGTVTVTISQTNWKQVNPNEDLGPYNACCDTHEETFKICDVPGCDVEVKPSSVTVGQQTDLKVNITSKGLACGCNVIVHVVPTGLYSNAPADFFTLANGQKVGELWFNISGSGIALPYGMTAPGSTYGATSDGMGNVTFAGITTNYCDYIKVEVFTTYTPSGCSPTPVWTFAYVNPIAIYSGISSQKLSYEIVGQSGDNNYLVAGVPDTVIIKGFKPEASLYYVSMDITGDGTWYNTDAKYTAVDNGDGTYTIQLTPPPSVFGYAYPNKIRIALRMDYDSQRCRLVGYVDIPVKLPTFETTITTACGDTFANDNLITEGFAEKITLTKLVDPRNGKDLTSFVTQFKAYSSTTCYIPTAWVDQQSCAGCNSLTISVLALDNPNVEAKPTVRLRVHMNGVRVRLYGAELTVTSPKISVTPNKDIPFTEPGKPITMLTFTATDAHGKPMCGVTFGIYDINTMNSYYTLSGQASSVSPNYCEPELSGKPFIPVLPAQEIYTLNIGSSFNYHTGTTGSDGTLVYPFTPGTGGRYAAMAISDIGQIGAPKAVLDAFMAKMKLILETVYKAPEVDKEAPKVTVSAPDKVTTATVKVTGKATDNVGVVSVWIGAKQASLAPDGTFEAVLDLVPGDNTFTVSAYDAAGNVGTATLKVSYVVPQVTKIVLKIGSDIMTVNGKVVQLDAAPEIKDGRTFLPLRAIAEAFGAQVTWVPETQGITVVLGNNQIGLQIGNNTAVVNGNVLSIVSPYIKNGRTMVPVRVIAEGLGAEVTWDPINYIVTITMQG